MAPRTNAIAIVIAPEVREHHTTRDHCLSVAPRQQPRGNDHDRAQSQGPGERLEPENGQKQRTAKGCRVRHDRQQLIVATAKQPSAIQPNTKAIVRHSKAGISSARSASAGHVAQSGITSTPTQVPARGESGRHCLAGGPSDSHKMAELEVMHDVCGDGARRANRTCRRGSFIAPKGTTSARL
jgi:hypothetical protein